MCIKFCCIFALCLTIGDGNVLSGLYNYRDKFNEDNIAHARKVSLPLGSSISMKISVNGSEFTLKLTRNMHLVSPQFSTSHFTQNNERITSRTSVEDSSRCIYHGTIYEFPQSSVALNICDGLRGVITIGKEILAIKPLEQDMGKINIRHVITKSDDEDSLLFGNNCIFAHFYGTHKENTEGSRKKRDVFSETKFVELIFVVDHAQFNHYQTIDNVVNKIVTVANTLDSLYKPLGVRIILSHIEVWNQRDMIDVSGTNNEVLAAFQQYRMTQISANASSESIWRITDNAQLILHDQTTNAVGLGYVNSMCSSFSVSIIRVFNKDETWIASVIGHELGHNLGMMHDTEGCVCHDYDHCIMSSHATGALQWSNCSVSDLETFLTNFEAGCLLNVPDIRFIFTEPHCGNEIVELGEQCDCGTPDLCHSSCCNSTTCQLHCNAECDEGLCCDENCKFRPFATLCRKASNKYGQNECDLPEYCNGISGQCPGDFYIRDGSFCNNGSSTCYGGMCVSKEGQCKEYWGEDAHEAISSCYDLNLAGLGFGSCGIISKGVFLSCSPENQLCGSLHCTSSMTETILRDESLTAYKTYRDSVNYCQTVATHNADCDDIGQVRDGIKCGENKICQRSVCVSLSDESLKCEDLCHGNGVCNDLLHCHCDDEWSPPFCNQSGTGGSIDSGPASLHTSVHQKVMLTSINLDMEMEMILSSDLQQSASFSSSYLLAFYNKYSAIAIINEKNYPVFMKIYKCWGSPTTLYEDELHIMNIFNDTNPGFASTIITDTCSNYLLTVPATTMTGNQLEHPHIYVHCDLQLCVEGMHECYNQ